ncbi:trigger factor [Sinorhizobium medicae]|uniref:Trigger factor n=2 Tax=Sinorhizobium medicae TaxID=110321 RepID=TIG_SINMW|nr:trigger factor [Sinorhizobium medicae]A6U8Q2.1 RecName: Full=Trigger factor; Short=TF; AltName: Full=PPIase [Sinorhizobium medicae WSM419]ABR60032.1 trigger factor [Sinorhizobium medicae WSM419]MBO1962205.1 trigger factor [Sinorhizobium medicae]MDX0406410.1 trigger factor [Sinorhizobium medicae]MDX0412106.1 trigger factor [Sinorhizobium medicae]MDX0418055.1 trigger factor [Sinorhizobium medicae]
MQVIETLAQGLKRELKVVIPADEMEARMNERLVEVKDRVRINGFRPGKVPVAHLKKVYGKSIMADLVNEIVREKPTEILTSRGEKSATQPEIGMTEDEAEADKILKAEADFEFTVAYEIIPPIELKDASGIKVTREVVDVGEDEVNEQIERIAESARTYESKKGKAANGDRVTIDYLGKVDGEAFDGGKDEDAELVLGSNRFIPGFEEQLVGAKAGDEKTITVTFPADYPAANLAGKEATFDVTVKDVAAAAPIEINDELATKLGLESVDKLKEIVRGQIESQFGSITRQKVKRQLLDQLDELYQFDTPERLVDAEFENIWRQINTDLQQAGKTFADEDTTEEEARAEYRKLAQRRVRLGLVLSEIGEKAGVQVSDDEMQNSLFQQLRQFPGQEKEIIEYFRNTPGAAASLRAPLFEEKVVDHLLTEVSVTDKKVSKEELTAEDDADEKPAKKTASKKKAAAKADAAEGEEAAAPKRKAPAKKKASDESAE